MIIYISYFLHSLPQLLVLRGNRQYKVLLGQDQIRNFLFYIDSYFFQTLELLCRYSTFLYSIVAESISFLGQDWMENFEIFDDTYCLSIDWNTSILLNSKIGILTHYRITKRACYQSWSIPQSLGFCQDKLIVLLSSIHRYIYKINLWPSG